MAATIGAAFDGFSSDLQTVVAITAVVGAVALLAWAGYRLGAKMINRGVGK